MAFTHSYEMATNTTLYMLASRLQCSLLPTVLTSLYHSTKLTKKYCSILLSRDSAGSKWHHALKVLEQLQDKQSDTKLLKMKTLSYSNV